MKVHSISGYTVYERSVYDIITRCFQVFKASFRYDDSSLYCTTIFHDRQQIPFYAFDLSLIKILIVKSVYLILYGIVLLDGQEWNTQHANAIMASQLVNTFKINYGICLQCFCIWLLSKYSTNNFFIKQINMTEITNKFDEWHHTTIII